MDTLLVASSEDLTYLEVVDLLSFISLSFHPVALHTICIDALLQDFRAKHVENEILFCNLDHRPSLVCAFMSV